MRLLISISFLLFSAACLAQSMRQKLIVAEFRIDTPRVGNFTYLVSYNFADGQLHSKDTILGAETFKKDKQGRFNRYVRFEFGGNFIYKNRYVVSGTGNVVDIEKKKLVIEEGDDFVSAQGDTLMFHRANIFTGTGYLLLNLKTGDYKFLNYDEKDRDRSSNSSPDKKHYLSIDRSTIPYKICLHDMSGQKKTLVADAGHGPNINGGSQSPTIEKHWLNNKSFLYAVHRLGGIDSSQFDSSRQFYSKFYSKVILHRFDITSNTDAVFFAIDNLRQGVANGRFFKDEVGQTIYRTSGYEYYVVDTTKNTLLAYPYYELGNGFSVENNYNPEGNSIHFNGREIGRMRPSARTVSRGVIAVEQGENRINIWSERTGMWSTIEIPWISSLIGWLEDE